MLSRPAWTNGAEWAVGALLTLLAIGVAWRGTAARAALAVGVVAIPITSWLAFEHLALLLDPMRPLELGGAALAGVTRPMIV